MDKKLATIMMVTYNRLDLTKKTLDCIFEHTDYPFELVFVDNASKDDTLPYLYEVCGNQLNNHPYLQSFKIQSNTENKGIAIGRNQALLLAEGEWLATMDNDVWVPMGWLSECIDVLSKNHKFGMIGVNMEGTSYPLMSNHGKEFQVKPQGNLGTACAVFPRSLHKMIGFFTWSEHVKYSHEDADFGFRARLAGFKLGYIKEMGTHLGEGENDKGEYREFKNKEHAANLNNFYNDCKLYLNKKKPIYIKFK